MNKVIEYANAELEKYLKLINNESSFNIQLIVNVDLFKDTRKKDFNIKLDDSWEIYVVNGIGKIVGVNERSVLLGVYRFLYFLGCRFISSNKGDEIIVSKKIEEISVVKDEIPNNRYRGIVIEGSVSVENVINMIDYAIKNGFNSYFIQLKDSYEFFRRWYLHESNEKDKKIVFNNEIASNFVKNIESEIEKRGILYHKVGHSWSSEVLNCGNFGWQEIPVENIDNSIKPFIAEIKGERKFFGNVPMNTSLCYSNEAVRKKFVDNVVKYAKINKHIDFLHIWLADGVNNNCECKKCSVLTLSDWYIKLLNEIDLRFSEEKINTKIVFLIYVDLLQPPKQEKIINEDRFVMMFAPIGRTYCKSYLSEINLVEEEYKNINNFKLNNFKFLTGIATNLSYLKGWKEIFKGDSFVFDYHQMWEQYKNFSGLQLSKTLYEDIKALSKIGLNGMMSCQSQRVFLPHGFNMYMLGQMLINKDLCYKKLKIDYFKSAFGENFELICSILEKIDSYNVFLYCRAELSAINKDSAKDFAKLNFIIKECIEEIKNCSSKKYFENRRIMALKKYLIILEKLSKILSDKCNGKNKDLIFDEYTKNVKPLIFKLEEEYQSEFDGYECNLIFETLIKIYWKVLPVNFKDVF